MKTRFFSAGLAALLPFLLGFNPITVESEHYLFKTDVPREQAREAFIRMDRAFEYYAHFFHDVGKPVDVRLDAAFFAKQEDLSDLIGDKRFPAMFRYEKGNDAILFTLFPGQIDYTWNMLQHEAMHQYVHHSIGILPAWFSEGIATYFGSAIFTGDSFVEGRILPGNLATLKQLASTNAYTRFSAFMSMSQAQWNKTWKDANYVQAWSMIHFLMHADAGAYRPRLYDYFRRVATAPAAERAAPDFGTRAWIEVFGADTNAWEARWKQWAAQLSESENLPVSRQANVRTILTFIDRLRIAGASITSMTDFARAVANPRLALPDDHINYLPPDLLRSAFQQMDRNARWELVTDPDGKLILSAQYRDGMLIRARYDKDASYKVTTSEIVGATPPALAQNPRPASAAATQPSMGRATRAGTPPAASPPSPRGR